MKKNVDYIVRSAQFILKKSSDSDYAYFLQCCKRHFAEVLPHEGLQKLGVLVTKIDEMARIAVPDEMIAYTRIGVLNGNRVWPLSIDPDLALIAPPVCLPAVDSMNADDEQGTNNSTVGGPWDVFYGATGTVPFAADGGYNLRYYRPDLPNGIIYFDKTLAGYHIVIEYLSNGGNIMANTLVPEPYVDCMVSYLLWMDIRYNDLAKDSEKQRRERDYHLALYKANFTAFAPILQEIDDAIYTASGDKLR